MYFSSGDELSSHEIKQTRENSNFLLFEAKNSLDEEENEFVVILNHVQSLFKYSNPLY